MASPQECLQDCRVLVAQHLKKLVSIAADGQRPDGQPFSSAFKPWSIQFLGSLVSLLTDKCHEVPCDVCVVRVTYVACVACGPAVMCAESGCGV